MKAVVWGLAICTGVVAGCRTAGSGARAPRLETARAISALRIELAQEQVVACLGEPQEVLGPIRMPREGNIETWTYYLPASGTPVGTPAYRAKLDPSCGVTLIMLNGRLLRKYLFGYWGEAEETVVEEARPRPRGRDLDELQAEWLAALQRDNATQRSLDHVKQELLQSSKEQLPGVVPGHQVPAPRGHSGRYVSVGK